MNKITKIYTLFFVLIFIASFYVYADHFGEYSDVYSSVTYTIETITKENEKLEEMDVGGETRLVGISNNTSPFGGRLIIGPGDDGGGGGEGVPTVIKPGFYWSLYGTGGRVEAIYISVRVRKKDQDGNEISYFYDKFDTYSRKTENRIEIAFIESERVLDLEYTYASIIDHENAPLVRITDIDGNIYYKDIIETGFKDISIFATSTLDREITSISVRENKMLFVVDEMSYTFDEQTRDPREFTGREEIVKSIASEDYSGTKYYNGNDIVTELIIDRGLVDTDTRVQDAQILDSTIVIHEKYTDVELRERNRIKFYDNNGTVIQIGDESGSFRYEIDEEMITDINIKGNSMIIVTESTDSVTGDRVSNILQFTEKLDINGDLFIEEKILAEKRLLATTGSGDRILAAVPIEIEIVSLNLVSIAFANVYIDTVALTTEFKIIEKKLIDGSEKVLVGFTLAEVIYNGTIYNLEKKEVGSSEVLTFNFSNLDSGDNFKILATQPEPSTIVLMLLGLVSAACVGIKKRFFG